MSPVREDTPNLEMSLDAFDPLIREWFRSQVGTPTEVQARAWPVISKGSHVLVSAPTGTGKTLTAFLWGLDRLARGVWPGGKVRILYVSPLKALANDIQRNLLSPLEGLGRAFQAAGRALPPIQVLTRSGDTPYAERQRMLRRPPEILITTPESLNLILSSPNARLMLDGVATVILDEVHAVASTKRGTHLITAVERIVRLSGEFQRIALSATVKPLSAVADFVGGFLIERGAGGEAVYRKRPVEIVSCPLSKRYEITVAFPGSDAEGAIAFARGGAGAGAPARDAAAPGPAPRQDPDDSVFSALAAECRRIISESRSTLFFVNSRRHAEKLCRFINEGQEEQLAWAHHGSLSRELRLVVEQRLKSGELKAIVATSSLELGIDIGALERVILIQTPFSVSSAIQRVGRAGHRIGVPSRAVIYPLHGRDLAEAAVMARCILTQDIETVAPVVCPLDILAQLIVSMTAVEPWSREDLYEEIRASYPFSSLTLQHFDLVLAMLAGKYAETRLRELSPLVSIDAIENTVRAREGAVHRLYMGGGTIPDRGYFSMRAADSKALIGELDEEFVWERSIGDTFFFGTQGWRISKIDHQNVEVTPVSQGTAMAPFWKAEERHRAFHFSKRIAEAFEKWTGMDGEALAAELQKEHALLPDSAKELAGFLGRQKEATGTDLPHRHHVLVEYTSPPEGAVTGDGGGGRAAAPGGPPSPRRGRRADLPDPGLPVVSRIVLHTLWGGRVNRPFSMALAAAWEERYGIAPQVIQDDDAILLIATEKPEAEEIMSLVTPENLERLLRKKLEGSGYFGARFRENASRSLLLTRGSLNRRMPLWFSRLRAKGLYGAVEKYDDFPMLIETWRTCLRDEFDMESLTLILSELASGALSVGSAVTPSPSPFCSGLSWKQTNTFMYMDDTPEHGGRTSLRPDLIRELALSSALRPQIRRETAAELQEKLQRTAPGYAPRDARELLDWVKERVLIPMEDWKNLLDACRRDHGVEAAPLEAELTSKIEVWQAGSRAAIAAKEDLPRIRRAVEGDDEVLSDLVSQWLRFYGPVSAETPRGVFGVQEERLKEIIQDLVDEEECVVDALIQGSEEALVCDRENLEALLRITRARARPELKALPVEALPLFLAQRQGLTRRGSSSDDLARTWETLFGCVLPARMWEEEVFPARLDGYRSAWLDSLFAGAVLTWFGRGRERIGFTFREDLELFNDPPLDPDPLLGIFPGVSGKYSFWDILDSSGLTSTALAEKLWGLAWDGVVSNDSFQTVRRGMENRFSAEAGAQQGTQQGMRRRGSSARGFGRWQASRPMNGYWFRLPAAAERDALEEEELNRDRIRQLLSRYGVLFREILESEIPPLQWGRLFRSLRIMELSGEVVAGRFFDGIPGLQFASPQIVEELTAALDEDAVYWMNAADPASLCGVSLEALKGRLPSRVSGTHLVYHGRRLVIASRRQAKDLEIRVPPGEKRLRDYLGFIRALANRDARPMTAVHVETVNDQPAAASPYKDDLLAFGFVEDFKKLTYRGGV